MYNFSPSATFLSFKYMYNGFIFLNSFMIYLLPCLIIFLLELCNFFLSNITHNLQNYRRNLKNVKLSHCLERQKLHDLCPSAEESFKVGHCVDITECSQHAAASSYLIACGVL